MNKKAALGKGLSALLADADSKINNSFNRVETTSERGPAIICEIELSKIEPNPYQPRMTFDEEAIEELAESIRSLGLIQPLTIRQLSKDKYQIISGERRLRAAKIAGLSHIPAYIRNADDTGMLEMAIVENIQRENLDAIETALSFQRLIDECNLTQDNLAGRVGKKRTTVTNYLRLLKLPVEIQKAIKIGKLSVGHAKVLLSIDDDEKQLELCEQIIRNDWSVRHLEDKIRKISEMPVEKNENKDEKAMPDEYYRILEVIGKYFDNNISLKRSDKGKGTMTIRFRNDEEIARFLRVLEDNNM